MRDDGGCSDFPVLRFQSPGTPDQRDYAALRGFRKDWTFNSLTAYLAAHPPAPDELKKTLAARDYLMAWYPKALAAVVDVDGVPNPAAKGSGIILCGTPGTCKTSLMVSTLRAAARQTPTRGTTVSGMWFFVVGSGPVSYPPPAPVWYHALRALSEQIEEERYHRRKRLNPDEEGDEMANRPIKEKLDDCDLIGLDDIDKLRDSRKHPSARELDLLEHLTNRVEGEGQPLNLILTTNKRPEQWADYFDPALADRWRTFRVFHFEGDSHRKLAAPAEAR